jgi:hypothetical protein
VGEFCAQMLQSNHSGVTAGPQASPKGLLSTPTQLEQKRNLEQDLARVPAVPACPFWCWGARQALVSGNAWRGNQIVVDVEIGW